MEGQLPNASEFVADLARSVGFLSRLPVPDRFFRGHDGSISRAVRAFPVAGLVIAALPAFILLFLASGDALLAALIALALMSLMTGALHEDGLADTADGLGGGRDRDQALAIMKDSRTGAYGVVALILSFGLRAAALAALARHAPPAAALALLAAAAVSRAVMVAHWQALPPARENGVAAGAGLPEESARNLALLIGGVVALLLLVPALGLPKTLLALIVAALAAFGFTRLVRRKLGGHTGDTIGATQQFSEIAMLATLALVI
ncbi:MULTISPECIES: adenosylcobinamide-GDP ribazoletransferase [Rhizobium/Agrobacterium group]|uniref:Adenosylcobinamide-GDP ribazoletransferase n=1 Tax=Neorhizobium petrolearium TaxID=515361 RepID=A0ABY8M6J7_9HYPH|nr:MULTISPECIES: adenosylcobinamide-GDP ribazoletransferase [Rhizobium/Agrobacterium group]KGD94452.1 cobalamin synthase [Rhizobium sp. YS-1r]MCC2609983.1 adenosylcobinamide-GDP ribazoletransferase [Neorhizobium petrolearium]WGI70163.1 adenosylcobinamide-GDP ribazoletransferase [Neorhizobium petrolearium]